MLATSELGRGLCELYKMALAQLCDSEWGLFPLRYMDFCLIIYMNLKPEKHSC